MLSALTSNPSVWAQTVLIINFDENDGFFDHIVAPTPPMSAAGGYSSVSTVNEIYPGTANPAYLPGPYGLGARVPMLIVSPWTKGGWVCSQTFDHTSVIQFIEKRFGVHEPNITPWRRAICGDLTSAFNFGIANATNGRLPNADSYLEYPTSTASNGTLVPLTHATIVAGKAPVPTYKATSPAVQTMPHQETGRRLARALPYEQQADLTPYPGTSQVSLASPYSGPDGAIRAGPDPPSRREHTRSRPVSNGDGKNQSSYRERTMG